MMSIEAAEYEGYHSFEDETDRPYGSFEVFYDDGWYWWACFPGCIPDGEPNGPFETSKEAWEDARER
jgi:hypothetical protein